MSLKVGKNPVKNKRTHPNPYLPIGGLVLAILILTKVSCPFPIVKEAA
jgi:hypothetical protein